MINHRLFLTGLLLASLTTVYAQHDHGPKGSTPSQVPITFKQVLSQALSDTALADYKMESSVMTLAPGATDTVSHRHDCELFGYVLEGEVQIALVTKTPVKYSAGQMFYEKRNILHTFAGNPNPNAPARVLLIFIIKNGRVRYTPEYAGNKK